LFFVFFGRFGFRRDFWFGSAAHAFACWDFVTERRDGLEI
jgi:hypothetical protein